MEVFFKRKCNKYHGSYISKVDMIDPHVLLCQYNTEDILLKRMIVSHLDTWSFSGYFVFQWPPLSYLPSMPATDIIINCRTGLSIVVIKKLLKIKATAVRSYLTKLSICPSIEQNRNYHEGSISNLWDNLKTYTVKSLLSCALLCVT